MSQQTNTDNTWDINDTPPSSRCSSVSSIYSTISTSTAATPPPDDDDLLNIVIPNPLHEASIRLHIVQLRMMRILQMTERGVAKINALMPKVRTAAELEAVGRRMRRLLNWVNRRTHGINVDLQDIWLNLRDQHGIIL